MYTATAVKHWHVLIPSNESALVARFLLTLARSTSLLKRLTSQSKQDRCFFLTPNSNKQLPGCEKGFMIPKSHASAAAARPPPPPSTAPAAPSASEAPAAPTSAADIAASWQETCWEPGDEVCNYWGPERRPQNCPLKEVLLLAPHTLSKKFTSKTTRHYTLKVLECLLRKLALPVSYNQLDSSRRMLPA